MSVVATHANPVTQAGFTMIPNDVMLRHDLSCGAKIIYGYLKHLAWRNGRNEEAVPRDIIQRDLGIGKNQVTKFIQELARTPVVASHVDADPENPDESMPRLVEIKRRGHGLPNLYFINDPRAAEEITLNSHNGQGRLKYERSSSKGRFEKKTLEVSVENQNEGVLIVRPLNLNPSEPYGSGEKNLPELNQQTLHPVIEGFPETSAPARARNGTYDPVRGKRIAGRDLAFDAISEETQADPFVEAGRIAKAKQLIRSAVAAKLPDEPWRADCESYEQDLACEIRRRAALYRDRWPNAELTPTALAFNWERVTNRRANGSLTTAEILELGRQLDEGLYHQ